jgi:hypothetical protein
VALLDHRRPGRRRADRQRPAPPAQRPAGPHQPLPPSETADRVAARAEAHGLRVFARLPLREGDGEWLVLGTAPEETALLQPAPGAPVSLPLTLRITPRGDGASLVQFHDRAEWAGQALPDRLVEGVAALPALIDDALS